MVSATKGDRIFFVLYFQHLFGDAHIRLVQRRTCQQARSHLLTKNDGLRVKRLDAVLVRLCKFPHS